MLSQVLRTLFRDEVESLQRKSTGIGLELQGLIVLLGALLFAVLALFLWLAETRPPWQAALVVAGLLLVCGGALVLAGREMLHRRKQAARRNRAAANDPLAALGQALGGAPTDPDKPGGTDPSTSVVTTALIAGITIGRFLRR